MKKHLLIIFVKNPEKGKVKTRLAATIGDDNALKVYHLLLNKTREVCCQLTDIEKHVYYSSFIDESDEWRNDSFTKKLQTGEELGERMLKSFSEGFKAGYDKIAIIGSDCFELSPKYITDAFAQLDDHDVVLGPAKDGGYYLLGMKLLYRPIFEHKKWSTESVFLDTIEDIDNLNLQHHLLPTLSDIDNEVDMRRMNIKV